MKKQFYSAPAAEQIEVRMETGILTESKLGSPASTTVETADYHEDVAW